MFSPGAAGLLARPTRRKCLPRNGLRGRERPPGFRRHLASRNVKGQKGLTPTDETGVEAEDAICRSNVPIGR